MLLSIALRFDCVKDYFTDVGFTYFYLIVQDTLFIGSCIYLLLPSIKYYGFSYPLLDLAYVLLVVWFFSALEIYRSLLKK